MGKGDKKSAKGKRWRGSYGNSRKRKVAKTTVAKVKKEKPAAAKKKKAPAKKAAKKTEE